MNFFSPYSHEFVRVAACVPRIGVGDPAFNVAQTLELVRKGDANKIALMIFPELGISAYAIDDLLFQDVLLDRVEAGAGRYRCGLARSLPSRRRRGAAASLRTVVQLRGRHFSRQNPRGRTEDVPAKLSGILRGTTLHIWCRYSRQTK